MRHLVPYVAAQFKDATPRPYGHLHLNARVYSDVAREYRLPQPLERVAGGNELLTDMAAITDFDQGLHDRPVADLLLVVELTSAGVACGVNVGDQVMVLLDPA